MVSYLITRATHTQPTQSIPLHIIFLLKLPMSFSSSSIACKPHFITKISSTSRNLRANVEFRTVVTKCEANGQSSGAESTGAAAPRLSIGSPIIITEAPLLIKTAASVPCLRANAGLVNPGDVGRIVSRKPMNVWAVRLSIGTFLVDEKYFKPLLLDE